MHEKSEYDFVVGADLLYKAAVISSVQTPWLESKRLTEVDSDVQVKVQEDLEPEKTYRNFSVQDMVSMFSLEGGSMGWKGPYEITKVLSNNYYVVQDNSGIQKPRKAHINQMRAYEEQREVMFPLRVEGEEIEIPEVDLKGNDIEEVQVMENLTPQQGLQLKNQLQQFKPLFSQVPGKTNILKHHIETGDHEPIRVSPYPLNGPMREIVRKELQQMMAWGVIQESHSDWGAPIVMVQKKKI